MDDIVLSHEVERDQDLNCETLNQTETESLKVVHLDEVVQVHAQQLERDHQVLPEHKLIQHLNDVLLVLRVLLVQHLNQLRFNKPLLVQPFFVLKHFQSDEFL